MRLGIRLSVYDDADNEIVVKAVWLPEAVNLAEWRPTYDAICAAIWEAVGELSKAASTVGEGTSSTD